MEKNNNPTVAREKLKKRIIAVFVGICLVLVLSSVAVSLLERSMQEDKPSEFSSSYIFFTPNYEENIFDNPEYMKRNRLISFSDGAVTTALTEADYESQADDTRFMIDYINTIMNGDAEAYNACFSTQYFADDENKPLERFTMQKLHEIKLTRTETMTEGEGNNAYTVHGYKVEYMIFQNDGTFRRDLDSDSIRAQYLVVTDREGDWKIDRVITYSYQ